MNTAEAIRRNRITLQVGAADLVAKDFSDKALKQAIGTSNKNVALAGLPSVLNAEWLDPERVRAFVAGLVRLPSSEVSLIEGRTVRLNLPALQLHGWSSVTAATLRRGFALASGSNEANPQLANVHLVAPVDWTEVKRTLALARTLARGDEAGARQRRSSAMIWAALAEELAKTDEPAWRGDVEASRAALATIPAAPLTGGPPGGATPGGPPPD